jgi:hypothetical protein
MAKPKSGGSGPTHTVADNTGNGSGNAATGAGDGDDISSSYTTFNGASSSWDGNVVARTHVQVDASGHTLTDDPLTASIDGKTSAVVGDAVHARAGRDKNHDPTAAANALSLSRATVINQNDKEFKKPAGATASAAATGGKTPTATATAKSGKEKVTVTAVAGVGVTASGGKTITLHPKPGETIAIEYTKHTEAVGISLPHRAEAYAAAAQAGHVYVGKSLIAAAQAAAYAFALGWNNGAYAYSAARSSATANSTDGFDRSHAEALVEAEAAIWRGGSVLHIKLPDLPNASGPYIRGIRNPVPPKVLDAGGPPLIAGIDDDPYTLRGFCMAKHIGQQWGLACTTVDKMPSQAEINARLRQGWTEIVASP